MSDPLLDGLQLDTLVFDLGGRRAPVSIRDQLIRGELFAQRALETGLIGPAAPLLIVGAGAAGVSAALVAAANGAVTILIDSRSIPFALQASCRTRWLDPTQYDWPLEHWRTQICPPWRPPSMMLSWGPAYADNVAQRWSQILARARIGLYPFLHVRLGMRMLGWPAPVPPHRLDVAVVGNNGSPVRLRVAMVALARGQGAEISTVSDPVPNYGATSSTFHSVRFWHNDSLAHADHGLPRQTSGRILVSGGGDGALQDFLRLATGCRAVADVWEAIRAIPSVRPYVAPLEARLAVAEEQAHRSLLWSNPKRPQHDHEILQRLEAAHVNALTDLRTAPGVWSAVTKHLDTMIAGRRLGIDLSHGCTHFGVVYGLNRFVALLLLEYFRGTANATRYTGRRLVRVDSTLPSHVCNDDPYACHGIEHKVTSISANCFGSGGPLGTSTHPLIVVRHGISEPWLPSSVKPLPVRQSIPFNLPY